MILQKPHSRPNNPRFSSGPCTKSSAWSLEALADAPIGRSHRGDIGQAKLYTAIKETSAILGIPSDYRVAIVPASDTGAVEMAMWNLLGGRGVDIASWESFGAGWVTDIKDHLKLENVTHHHGDYGYLPDLSKVNFNNDFVFTWNGTTSGVCVPNGDFIPDDRGGLTICDATSAAFAKDLPWDKLDVTTFSWQKVLGSEAAHGILILSPRAVERLETYTPPWPLPKIFRLTEGGKLIDDIFEGITINTPSMLAVEDYLFALKWVKSIGGLSVLIDRANENLSLFKDYVSSNDWISFLTQDIQYQSNTSICLKIIDPQVTALSVSKQAEFAKAMVTRLADEGVAYDIGSYCDAPAGLRVWAGGTVEKADIENLLPWITWSFNQQLLLL